MKKSEDEELDPNVAKAAGAIYPTPQKLERYTLVGSDRVLLVHPASKCKGEYCCIHNPSDHHMRDWPQNWRDDRRIMERICPHGIGHPDPDDPKTKNEYEAVHGCDGCCDPGGGIKKSYTPRTDDVVSEPCAPHEVIQKWEKIINTSRQLERELNEALVKWDSECQRNHQLMLACGFRDANLFESALHRALFQRDYAIKIAEDLELYLRHQLVDLENLDGFSGEKEAVRQLKQLKAKIK